ncbi:MAG: hypothetical protein ABDH91_07455 [Bacteroidia bacterium]
MNKTRTGTTATYEGISVSFDREAEGAKKLRELLESFPAGSPERQQLEAIHAHYEDLLATARLLTRMGDRLQAKLRHANEELARKNEEIARYNRQLEATNRELRETLEALQESQRRRKALTVLGLSAIAIFMITEVIEYYIEQTTTGAHSQWTSFASFALKALVAIAFKPLEELVETLLSHTVRR